MDFKRYPTTSKLHIRTPETYETGAEQLSDSSARNCGPYVVSDESNTFLCGGTPYSVAERQGLTHKRYLYFFFYLDSCSSSAISWQTSK